MAFASLRANATCVIYALGGGMGHLTRGLALARHAARDGRHVWVLSNSRFAPLLAGTGPIPRGFQRLIHLEPQIEMVPIPWQEDKQGVAAAIQRFFHAIPAPEVLVVDTFPRGLAGELKDLLRTTAALKVLVHRDLNPEYLRWESHDSCIPSYDLILVPGEAAPLEGLPQARRTTPWLICDLPEFLSVSAARAVLGAALQASGQGPTRRDQPLIVVIGTGKPAETFTAAEAALDLSRRVEGRALVRLATFDDAARARCPDLACSVWPLLAVHQGIDLLIGAGGYNTVYEARGTGTPLIAVAQPRLYDRQARRLRPTEIAADWSEGIDLAERQLDRLGWAPKPTVGELGSGAGDAWQWIELG
ncbi:MAG: hypothetical protein ACKV0T_25270 [Planctomycetales bacterium]